MIVTAKKEEYIYLDLLKGLELDILETPNDLTQWGEMCCDYISVNYESIDVMFCFGLYPSHFRMVELYKRLRPDGKVILKLDANIYWEDRMPFRDSSYADFLSNCNVITVESKKLKKHLSRKWPYKIDYAPNASLDFTVRKRTEYSEKENIILTVGRIGQRKKQTKYLWKPLGWSLMNYRLGN